MVKDPNYIKDLIENQGLSMSEVSRKLNINVGSISAFCKKHNIKSKHMDKMSSKILPIIEVYNNYLNGDSIYVLSKKFNAPQARIRRQLRKAYPDLVLRNADQAVRPIELNNPALLSSLALEMSFTKIAHLLKVKVATVCKAAKKFGIRSIFELAAFDIPYAELEQLYVVQRMTPGYIAKLYEVPYNIVLKKLRSYNFIINGSGGVEKPSKYSQLNDKEWLKKEYVEKQHSLDDISKELNCSLGLVRHYIAKYEIPLRTKSEYMKLLLARRHGQRIEYKGMLFDSKLEKEFIEQCSGEHYERNVELKANGSICYIDFKVDEEYWEVKSRENSCVPGPNRRRLIKQYLIAKNNKIDLNIWNGQKFKLEIEPIDIYYCSNWKLLFNDANDCSKWLLEYGFHGVEYPIGELLDGITNEVKPGYELNANYQNEHVLKLIRHFSQHYWISTHNEYLPVSAAWEIGNSSIIKRAVEQLWENKQEINLYSLTNYICKYFKDFTRVSIFKPWVAKHIYQRYLPNGGVIVDPCMGWGGRLIGCIGLNVKYYGFDLNQLSIDSHIKLRKFIGDNRLGECVFVQADSSRCDFPKADLVFTSPPYDNCELYHGIDSSKTKTLPIIENILSKCNCIVALNIPKRQRELCLSIAKKYSRELLEELQMKTSSFMGREKTYEPILVFKEK